MTAGTYHLPKQTVQMQKPMLRVCYALLPLVGASVYLFGWRSVVLIGLSLVVGTVIEAAFTFTRGKPVTSAVFVSCLIFSLSLPPTVPFWMAALGIFIGISLGKMIFGGFGQNVFNPAMVGRCFLYITFPIQMTNQWVRPQWGGWAGVNDWLPDLDALTQATPLMKLREGMTIPLSDLFLGNTAGSLGETSAVLIILGGAYIVYKKAAPWRIAAACLAGGLSISGIMHAAGFSTIPPPIHTVLSGSFLFGTAFVATEPISGAKTKEGQWIYGFFIGGLSVVLRGFSNFSEGIMFSVLLMNAFVPLMDQYVRQIHRRAKQPS